MYAPTIVQVLASGLLATTTVAGFSAPGPQALGLRHTGALAIAAGLAAVPALAAPVPEERDVEESEVSKRDEEEGLLAGLEARDPCTIGRCPSFGVPFSAFPKDLSKFGGNRNGLKGLKGKKGKGNWKNKLIQGGKVRIASRQFGGYKNDFKGKGYTMGKPGAKTNLNDFNLKGNGSWQNKNIQGSKNSFASKGPFRPTNYPRQFGGYKNDFNKGKGYTMGNPGAKTNLNDVNLKGNGSWNNKNVQGSKNSFASKGPFRPTNYRRQYGGYKNDFKGKGYAVGSPGAKTNLNDFNLKGNGSWNNKNIQGGKNHIASKGPFRPTNYPRQFGGYKNDFKGKGYTMGNPGAKTNLNDFNLKGNGSWKNKNIQGSKNRFASKAYSTQQAKDWI